MELPAKRSIPWSGIKLLLSALLLALTLCLVPKDSFIAAMRRVRIEQWLLVLAAYLCRHVISAWKWWLLLRRDAEVPLLKVVRAYFWGLFANLYLPGMAGGDLLKAGLVARNSGQKTRIFVRTMADRGLDTLALLLLSFGGALFLARGDNHGALDIVLKLGLLAVPALLGLMLAGSAARLVSRLPAFKGREKISRMLFSVAEMKRQPGTLVIVILISIAGHAVFVLLNISLVPATARGAGMDAWFFAWPLAKLLAVLPITIAGLGLREGALAGLLLPFGADPARVVAIGLMWQSIVFAGGLTSGLIAVLLDAWTARRVSGVAPQIGQGAGERVEILAYHSISMEPGVTSILPDTFRSHLRILEEEGYEVIDFPDVAQWMNGGKRLPRRAAILTFDDGFRDFADNAAAEILARGWTATVFLPTGLIGGRENWDGANVPPRALMDWSTIAGLAQKGIRFGAHTVTHPDLTALAPAEAEAEVEGSVRELERRTGVSAPVFAAPYGKTTAAVRGIIGKYCPIAVGTTLSPARADAKITDLPRIEMHYFRDLRVWRAYLRGEAELYFGCRVALRRVRQMLLRLAPKRRTRQTPSGGNLCPAP